MNPYEPRHRKKFTTKSWPVSEHHDISEVVRVNGKHKLTCLSDSGMYEPDLCGKDVVPGMIYCLDHATVAAEMFGICVICGAPRIMLWKRTERTVTMMLGCSRFASHDQD